MKVALVHDWLIHMRGGEKVLDAIAELYPDATLFTLFCDRKKMSPRLARLKRKTSFFQYLPGVKTYYRWLLPLLPWAIRSLKIKDADLVISSSHCVAKGIQIPSQAKHLCYCHTPMRYLWRFEDLYFKKYPFFIRALIRLVFKYLKKWDIESNRNVHLFISNSEYIRQRIRDVYEKDAKVIYPPVDTEFYHPVSAPGDYYVAVSHFVPYKRLDLVIEAFNRLDRKLMVVGDGPLESKYRGLRKSPQICFVGPLEDTELRKVYSGARALLFPAEEDFGIVPVEAQACGTPVIAYGKGGALEGVRGGIFFDEQTSKAIINAVLKFEKETFDRQKIREEVISFNRNHFMKKFKEIVEKQMSQKGTS